MNTAQQLVAILLETGEAVRVCAGCQKEFGVRPGPNESHGYCKRHLIEMYQQMMQYPQGKAKAEQSIRDIQQRPDDDFPPDLAQQQRQAVPA
jgi:hypothetical protein